MLQKQSQRQFLFSPMVHVKETQAHVEREHVYFSLIRKKNRIAWTSGEKGINIAWGTGGD